MPSSSGEPGPRWAGDGALGRSTAPARPSADDGSGVAAIADVPASEGPGHPAPNLPKLDYAPIWRRVAAWLVDEMARAIFYAVLVVFVLGVSDATISSTGDVNLRALLPQIVMRIGLSWIFWSRGISPGAVLLRVRLVGPDGEVPGTSRAGVRAALEVVSVLGMFIGFAWALVSRRRQTWHDLAAGTYVVNLPPGGPRN